MKKHYNRLKASLLFFMMLPVLFHANIAMGLSDEQRKIFNYSIPYFNTGGKCGSGETEANDDSGSSNPTANQEAFVQKYGQSAFNIGKKAGIPYEIILSQAALESGWGGSKLTRLYNNFFGIKAGSAWKGKRVNMATSEYGAGGYYNINDDFRVYDTPEQGFEGYAHFIHDNSRYSKALAYRDNPQRYIEEVWKAGYATAPDYVSKVMSIEKTVAKLAQEKLGLPPSSEMTFEIDPAYANHESPDGSDSDGSSDNCESLSGSNNEKIAKLAEEWGKWDSDYKACYVFGGMHTTDKAKIDAAVENHFTGQYGVDCSSFVSILIYKATGHLEMNSTVGFCSSSNFTDVTNDPKPGDISITCDSHVEVITKVNDDGTFETVGAHTKGCGGGHGPSPGKYKGQKVLRFKG